MKLLRHKTHWQTCVALLSGVVLVNAHVDFANAFDLFGASDDAEQDSSVQGEPLWEELEAPHSMTPRGVPESFADLAEQVSPAVVNIRIILTGNGDSSMPRQFREFHGFPFRLPERDFPFRSWGEGTGFVITKTGYIVTNSHVVDGADEIEVILLGGKKLRAEIVGLDKKVDIALLKVEPEEPLHAIPLGDSSLVRPGQWVVAIGNSMSLEHTVTAGIVSAKHRYLARGSYDDFIQTDAAINPGNSGGPLINMAGEVIGINTAINPAANTMGFAVPINMAKQILPQLKNEGHVTRSWLGVEIRELSDDLKEDSAATRGALVNRVLPATPAMRAGIQTGDVILSFDGNPVESHRQLPGLVANTPVDRDVVVEVLRDGKTESITVTLAAMEEPERSFGRWRHPPVGESEDSTTLGAFGLDAQELTPDLAAQLGLEDDKGLIVTRVATGRAADDAGLRRGDVILEVEGDGVDSVDDLESALEKAGKGAILLVRRDRATLFVPLEREG
ncbi:MAG: Do family serine endopeptidase [Deltaproteobacteria bacterium]|nr:Do family serine endopeptidase [Deltaproteobacteria bacterium]MBW2725446.1 Do family serine endopeptidase [Deltaproteobacteria bacterium]